jgi:LacI family transcriptional regulator
LSKPLKIAYLSPLWNMWTLRVVAGAFQYADANPPIIVRSFAPAKNLDAAVADLEQWGAEGILGTLQSSHVETVLRALKRPIPIVNNATCNDYPGVLRLVFSFPKVAAIAVSHFQQLGLRSKAMLMLEGGTSAQKIIDTFLQIANPPEPSRACLPFAADEEKLLNPHAAVEPVPKVLADWLHSLPKPTGILCNTVGGGGYLIRCCQALGLRVPEDIAVIGEDDNDLSLATEPAVTSICFAHETLGFEAIRLLKDWLAGKTPSASIFSFDRMELRVRGSTGLRKPEICDIASALKYIDENACRGVTVAQVIKETQGVARQTFYNRFQEVLGKSPADAIRDRKLDEVRRLLTTTDLPLTMVSDLAGFSTALFLSKIFRRAEGVTMSDYRKSKGIHASRQAKTPHRSSAKS